MKTKLGNFSFLGPNPNLKGFIFFWIVWTEMKRSNPSLVIQVLGEFCDAAASNPWIFCSFPVLPLSLSSIVLRPFQAPNYLDLGRLLAQAAFWHTVTLDYLRESNSENVILHYNSLRSILVITIFCLGWLKLSSYQRILCCLLFRAQQIKFFRLRCSPSPLLCCPPFLIRKGPRILATRN